MASEALASETRACLAANQEKQHVKEETRKAEAKGKATNDDHRITDEKDHRITDEKDQEVLQVPNPPKKYSVEERRRTPCRYFAKGKGICYNKSCGFGHMARNNGKDNDQAKDSPTASSLRLAEADSEPGASHSRLVSWRQFFYI